MLGFLISPYIYCSSDHLCSLSSPSLRILVNSVKACIFKPILAQLVLPGCELILAITTEFLQSTTRSCPFVAHLFPMPSKSGCLNRKPNRIDMRQYRICPHTPFSRGKGSFRSAEKHVADLFRGQNTFFPL